MIAARQKLRAGACIGMRIKTQYDNVGDALINRELIRLAAARAVVHIDASNAPQTFVDSLELAPLPQVTVHRRLGFIRMLARLLAAKLAGRPCYLLLTPGGLGGKQRTRRQVAAAGAYNMVLRQLSNFGISLSQIGVSFEAMTARELKVSIPRLRMLSHLAVRDELSQEYLATMGIMPEKLPDLAFNLGPPPAEAKSPPNVIAVSFRFDGKADADAIYSAVDHLVSAMTTSRFRFVAQVGRDSPGMARLHAHFAGVLAERGEYVVSDSNIDRTIDLYRDCGAVYSNRLHALLMAAHAGAAICPVVKRGTQPKIEGLFTDLGLAGNIWWLGESPPADVEPHVIAPTEWIERRSSLEGYFEALLGPRDRGSLMSQGKVSAALLPARKRETW